MRDCHLRVLWIIFNLFLDMTGIFKILSKYLIKAHKLNPHRHCGAALKLGVVSARSAVPGVHEGPAVGEALLGLVVHRLHEELEVM